MYGYEGVKTLYKTIQYAKEKGMFVDYSLVELPYSLSRTLERLAVFLELLFLDVFRNIVKLWVKTHY